MTDQFHKQVVNNITYVTNFYNQGCMLNFIIYSYASELCKASSFLSFQH